MSILILNEKNSKFINKLSKEEQSNTQFITKLIYHYYFKLYHTDIINIEKRHKLIYIIKILLECKKENRKGALLKIVTEKNKEDTCAICTEDYKLNDEILILQCNHIFHKSCISEWVLFKANCPCCRKDINIEKR